MGNSTDVVFWSQALKLAQKESRDSQKALAVAETKASKALESSTSLQDLNSKLVGELRVARRSAKEAKAASEESAKAAASAHEMFKTVVEVRTYPVCPPTRNPYHPLTLPNSTQTKPLTALHPTNTPCVNRNEPSSWRSTTESYPSSSPTKNPRKTRNKSSKPPKTPSARCKT